MTVWEASCQLGVGETLITPEKADTPSPDGGAGMGALRARFAAMEREGVSVDDVMAGTASEVLVAEEAARSTTEEEAGAMMRMFALPTR